MTDFVPKLTTVAACEVAGIDRDRFNEHVAAGNFHCAPPTTAGKARLFDPDNMLALVLFRRFTNDGIDAKTAGNMACDIARVAREFPELRSIAFVFDYFSGGGRAYPPDQVPAYKDWDNAVFSGTDIREVRYYRIGKERDMIAHYTKEQFSIAGPRDE